MLVLNPVLGWVALKKLERKAGAPIQGFFLPHVILPAFTLRDARVDWQRRFRVVSGTLQVRYDPFSLIIPGRKFQVSIEATNLPVQFAGDLAASQGFSRVTVDRVAVDLAFFEKGNPEIYLLDVRSKEMTFRLVKEEGSKSVN